MPLIAKIPFNRSFSDAHGAYPTHLNVLSRKKNRVQRQIRKGGLGSYGLDLKATLLASCEASVDDLRFFDIGAHIGLHSALIAAIFHSVNPYIVSVEPTPDTASDARILRRVNNLQYTIVESAVSDIGGDAVLHLADRAEALNSLNPSSAKSSSTVRVPVTTLDQLVGNGFAPPTVVKIDVETIETAALRGGLTVMSEHRPVIVTALRPTTELETMGAVLKAMEHLGYRCYQVTPDASWEACNADQTLAKVSDKHRYWVCAPEALGDEFFTSRMVWRNALSLCGEATNVLVDAGLPVNDHVTGTVGFT